MTQSEKLVFLDLETTGANAAADRITEIGLVEVDDGEVTRWSTLVNPEIPIPPFIQRLTGIDDRMVSDAPPIDAVLDTVRSRLDGAPVHRPQRALRFRFPEQRLPARRSRAWKTRCCARCACRAGCFRPNAGTTWTR